MLELAPPVKYKRGDCFSVLKVPRDGISKVAPLDASLPQGRPYMRLSLSSPSPSKCSEGLWGKLEWGKAEGRYSIPPPAKATAKSRREHREQSICEHHTCPGQNSSDKCSQGPSQASAEPVMCLALRLPDPGLKLQGTGDSLWRRTEEDLGGGGSTGYRVTLCSMCPQQMRLAS